MQLETAVQKAVDECIQEEILEEFLRKNRAEVIAVSIFEYDKEEEERKLRKAEFEAGEQSGIQKGIQEGIQEGKELKTKEIVNSLLQDGMGIEKIAELLKISREHVLELAGMKMFCNGLINLSIYLRKEQKIYEKESPPSSAGSSLPHHFPASAVQYKPGICRCKGKSEKHQD